MADVDQGAAFRAELHELETSFKLTLHELDALLAARQLPFQRALVAEVTRYLEATFRGLQRAIAKI